MQDPRTYLNQIRENLSKLQSKGQITATENALFGMIDGLAGLQLVTLERVTRLEQQLNELRRGQMPVVAPPEIARPISPPAPSAAQ